VTHLRCDEIFNNDHVVANLLRGRPILLKAIRKISQHLMHSW